VAALLHLGIQIIAICGTIGVSERLIFIVKKLLKDGNDLRSYRLEVKVQEKTRR
jgi:hypothetical protein